MPEYNYDYDGRPSVECGTGADPLLAALMREHPELNPGVRPPRAGDQGIAAGGSLPDAASVGSITCAS